jgi:hypothetical protein
MKNEDKNISDIDAMRTFLAGLLMVGHILNHEAENSQTCAALAVKDADILIRELNKQPKRK